MKGTLTEKYSSLVLILLKRKKGINKVAIGTGHAVWESEVRKEGGGLLI